MATFNPTPDAADFAAAQDILKEVWVSNTIESQLYEETKLLDIIDADVTEYTDSDGLKASVPIKVGRTAGISARQLGEPLGVAGHQPVRKASYNYKNLYLQVKVEGPLIARMKTDRQSCVREINWRVETSIADFKQDYIRQLQGDGSAALTRTGLAAVGSASRTIALGRDNLAALERGWIYEGMHVDIGTMANPTADTGGNTIVEIDDDPAAPRIVLENATTVSAGSHMFRYGNRTAANGSSEIMGLNGIASATTRLGGLDPADVRQWKATIESNSGTARALSIDLLLTLRRRMKQRGGTPNFLYGDLVQEQRYYNLLQPQVRFGGDSGLRAGSTDGLGFSDMTFVADAAALPGQVLMARKKAIMVFSAGKLAWQNQTAGGDMLAWDQGYDAFVGRAAKYCELGTNHRADFGRLEDLS